VNPIEKDPLQRRLEILNWIVLCLFTAISLTFFSDEFTMGILLGGLISIVSFSWRQRDLRIVFRNLTERSKASIMARYFIRFTVSAILIYLIITKTSADVIGLLIGLSIVVFNVMVTVFMSLLKKNDSEEIKQDDAP
jgi:MFS superfamily sulfate permease-like transporter